MTAILSFLAAILIPLGGDAIGPDASLTDATGGFSMTTGVPAVYVETIGTVPVKRLEAVVFGPFDPMRMDVPVWSLARYVANEPPDLVAPIINASSRVWGNSGVAGGNRETSMVELEVQFDLPAGQWVVGARSTVAGTMISGSRADPAPTGLYERIDVTPRSVLPDGIAWAMNVMAEPCAADLNSDGVVDFADFGYWEVQFGDSMTGEDMLAWQRSCGVEMIPEPYGWFALFLLAAIVATWRSARV